MRGHEYDSLASLARSKAHTAMHQGHPVEAREWISAAGDAERAKQAATFLPTPIPGERIADALERIADALDDQRLSAAGGKP
jgi:hypothetical protein